MSVQPKCDHCNAPIDETEKVVRLEITVFRRSPNYDIVTQGDYHIECVNWESIKNRFNNGYREIRIQSL